MPEHAHSYHHQALKDVATDLVVVARAPDGVIEAVEHHTCDFVVGVQWHPEDDAETTACQQRLFTDFVAKCGSR
jgi:putative glutamine amidotransferase